MKTLPATDVLIIGSGWTGLLMAKELSGRTPLSHAKGEEEFTNCLHYFQLPARRG